MAARRRKGNGMDFARAGTRRGAAVLATVCSAALFYFGTGLTPIGVLTWFAPLPVLLVAPRVSGRLAAAVAFVSYLLSTANSWDFQLHSHDEPMFPIGIIINVGSSLVFMLGVLLYRGLLRRRRVLPASLAVPAVWVSALYLMRLANPTGLLGTLASDQGDLPLVLQTTSVTGMWGVEFLVLFAPSAAAALLAPGVATAARVRTGTVAALVLAVAFGAGAWRLSKDHGAAGSRTVAAVSPNHFAWAPAVDTTDGRSRVAGYVRRIAALPETVTTVVLPEAAFGSSEARPADLVAPMRAAAKAHRINIVVGFQHHTDAARKNLALVFPASGAEPLSYLKHHDIVSPRGKRLVHFGPDGARVGVEICADVNFADPSRGYGTSDTGLLAIPASDNDANGRQHDRGALMRGVENGIPVVWSAQQGTLMISDDRGRVLAEAHTGGPGRFTTVTATVTPGSGGTFYARFGDWFAWLCLAMTFAGILAACLGRRREPGPGTSSEPGLDSPSASLTSTA